MNECAKYPDTENLRIARLERAGVILAAGGINQALEDGILPQYCDITLSEALVLGLLKQGVTRYFSVFGHGSTEIGEVLRIYQEVGLVKVFAVRSEIEASHAASALRWITGEKAAVITSIGPGALQAVAASLVAASDGLGVWYLFGDETTHDEGFNMQQIPRHVQGGFLNMFSCLSDAYSLHTPGALSAALARGRNAVDDPYRARPFFLLLPMNTQAEMMYNFNLAELPVSGVPRLAAADGGADAYAEAAAALLAAERVVIRAGGGSRECSSELTELAELCDAVIVTSPLVSGVVPYRHIRNMGVAGSKGSICGNYAMENADLLLTVGSRAVCQSDSSRTAWPNVKRVISINALSADALHYNRTQAFVGDARETVKRLIEALREALSGAEKSGENSPWLKSCMDRKTEWEEYKHARYTQETLYDEKFGRELLTQPAAIKAATDWARASGAVALFDAGDVQANGFQIVEDERPGQTFTETGASYMGWAVSALLASAAAENPFYGLAFSGDGSFMMNPQILIDGVQHGACGCILLLDNRRMAAISSLQKAQYGLDFATDDGVEVDYMTLASAVRGVNALFGGYSKAELIEALDRAREYEGLSLIHVPVYFGDDPLGGLGAWGRWNVGNWVCEVQALRHKIGL